jgi:hypothetical protein
LLSVYEDIKDEIPSLVKLHQICKEKGIHGQEIITLVEILNEVSNLEEYRDKLKKQIKSYEEKYRHV